MPTPLDRALQQRNLTLAFAGVITAVAAWSIWGQDLFPQPVEPKGAPESWSDDEMRLWLRNRKLMGGTTATRNELLAMVKAAMNAPA